MFEKILTEVSLKAQETIGIDEKDYIKDGLLYCYKCNTPKQHRLKHHFGANEIVFKLCECGEQRKAQRLIEEKRQERLKQIYTLRDDAFPTEELKSKLSGFDFTADDNGNPYISQVAKNYVNNFSNMLSSGKGIIFYGNTGVGKTFSSLCIINSLIDQGVPCGYIDFPRLISEFRSRQDKQSYIDSFNRFKLLVADDLGAESDTNYSLEITYNLINTRYLAGLPTIITTNLTGEQLKNPCNVQERRLFSRLFEMCVPIECTGSDRRKKKLADEFKKYADILGIEGK